MVTNLQLVLDAGRPRRWQLYLAERLRILPGIRIQLLDRRGDRIPRIADSLVQLETCIYGIPDGYALQPIPGLEALSEATTTTTATNPDLVIDTTGTITSTSHAPVLSVRCNFLSPEPGALDAVLSGIDPFVGIDLITPDSYRNIALWRVAIEDHDVVTRAVGNVLGRTIHAAIRAAEAAIATDDTRTVCLYFASEAGSHLRPPVSIPLFATRALARKVLRRISNLTLEAPRWHVGWRVNRSAFAGIPDLHGRSFRRLNDDGRRFYADPFVWSHDDRTFLFLEEYPFATSRGMISITELSDRDTIPATPRPILETGHHLSYPLLLEDRGILYMIPETSARETVELWRCTSFPDRWEQERVLIQGVKLVDATITKVRGIWYLLASQADKWTSDWDTLSIWSAPTLLGPWSAHPANPILVDVTAARPAGKIFVAEGRLIRPAQDSSARYGGALKFAVIEHLDEISYSQRIAHYVHAAPPLIGVHTYNALRNFEVVDAYGRADGTHFSLCNKQPRYHANSSSVAARGQEALHGAAPYGRRRRLQPYRSITQDIKPMTDQRTQPTRRNVSRSLISDIRGQQFSRRGPAARTQDVADPRLEKF